MKNKDSVFSLFISFAKIGLFTFGGGMAMLPMLERECVDSHKWITKEEMLDIYAIGQCTPGIIAVNTATFVGYKKKGIPGAVFATFGMVFPSLVIIILLASVLSSFRDNIYLQKAFNGIRIAVCALISGAVIKLSKNSIKDFENFIIAFFAMFLQILLGVSPAIIVVCVILWAAITFFLKKRSKK